MHVSVTASTASVVVQLGNDAAGKVDGAAFQPLRGALLPNHHSNHRDLSGWQSETFLKVGPDAKNVENPWALRSNC